MPVETKLIFGLRTSQEVTLRVEGHPGPDAPDLLIKTRGQASRAPIAYDRSAWIATIAAGDHVVWMEAPGDRWFEGEVQFVLTAVSTIVIHSDKASPKPMAWQAAAGAIDPKNPWPRPLAAVPLTDQAWFSDTLQRMNGDIATTRGSLDLSQLLREAAP